MDPKKNNPLNRSVKTDSNKSLKVSADSNSGQNPSKANLTPPAQYQKPEVKIHAPLDELTFLTGSAATGVGVIVSGGGL